MTRAQYAMLCIIGAVAVLAFLESQRVAAALRNITTPVGAGRAIGGVV